MRGRKKLNNMKEIIQNFADALIKSAKKPTPYDTVATVKRIEGETAWIHIPGGVDETPAEKTIDCNPGDSVRVRVSGGSAWITGNATAPPTDDTAAIAARVESEIAKMDAQAAKTSAELAAAAAGNVSGIASDAKTAADAAKKAADEAKETADSVSGVANEAKTVAEAAKETAEETAQHFWADDDGVHVSEITKESGGGTTGKNVIITSNGMQVRKGTAPLADFSGDGITLSDENYDLFNLRSGAYTSPFGATGNATFLEDKRNAGYIGMQRTSYDAGGTTAYQSGVWVSGSPTEESSLANKSSVTLQAVSSGGQEAILSVLTENDGEPNASLSLTNGDDQLQFYTSMDGHLYVSSAETSSLVGPAIYVDASTSREVSVPTATYTVLQSYMFDPGLWIITADYVYSVAFSQPANLLMEIVTPSNTVSQIAIAMGSGVSGGAGLSAVGIANIADFGSTVRIRGLQVSGSTKTARRIHVHGVRVG